MTTSLKERLELAMQGPPAVTAADLARACKVRPPSVSDWLSGKTKSLKGQSLLLASRALSVSPDWLGFGRGPMRSGNGSSNGVSGIDETPDYVAPTAIRRVPVVGTASLGMDGYWSDLEYPAGQGDGYFEFPTRDRDAYVLAVRGNSMHPAIRSGWYVLVEPSKTPQMGEFVLVKLSDGRATVKEFLWHRDGEYVLNAVSTGDRMVLQEHEVEFIHHVGGILPPSGRMP